MPVADITNQSPPARLRCSASMSPLESHYLSITSSDFTSQMLKKELQSANQNKNSHSRSAVSSRKLVPNLSLRTHLYKVKIMEDWTSSGTGAAVNVGQCPQVEIILQRYRAKIWRTSPVVQWLGLWAPNAGAPCSIPGQGTGYYTPQLRIHKL